MRSPLRLLAIAVGLLAASAAVLLWWQADRARDELQRQILLQAEQRSLQLADAMAGQVSAFLNRVDLSLLQLRALHSGRGRQFDEGVRAVLDSFPPGSVTHVSTTDRNGYITYDSLGSTERVYVGDRRHFQVLQQAGEDRLVIGRPVLSRISGKWSFSVGRPILRGGQFDGSLQILVSSEYLATRLARLELSRKDIVALMLAEDGTFLARSRDNDKAMGTGVPKDRPFLAPGAPNSGIFRVEGLLDGTARTYGWQQAREYGLIVAIGLADETVLAPLASGLLLTREVSAGLSLVVVVFGIAVILLLLRLAGKQEQLAESAATLRLVVDNVPMMIAYYDAQLRCRFSNRAYAALRGLGIASVVGKPMGEIISAESLREFMARLPQLQAGATVRYQAARISAEGRRVILDVLLVPYVPEGGAMQGTFVLLHDITEQALAAEQLRLSEARFRSLTNLSSDWYWEQDEHFRFCELGDAGLRVDLHARNPVGKARWELDNTNLTPRQWAEHRALLERHEPFRDFEFMRVAADGSSRWVRISGEPVFNEQGKFTGYRGVGKDITAVKEAEAALRESESRFRSVFEQAAVGMTLRSVDGQWIAINEVFAKMVGYTIEELRLQPLGTITHPEDEPAATGRLQSMARGELDNYQNEKRYVTKDGRVIWIDFWASLVRDQLGRPAMRLAVIQDVTARKCVEEEIRRLNAELEHRVAARTAELAAANRELETFAYTVSHDLKAPLRGIDGFSRLLLEDHAATLNEEGRRFLENVRQGARSMNELIEDLLAYSRIERGGRVAESLALQPLVESLVAERRSDPAAAHCRLSSTVPDLRALVDREGLTVALRNLLDNAVKFTVHTPEAQVEVGGRDNGATCVLWVHDNGPGFDMKYHDRIFGIFERLHRTEDYPGTGVGLAIVQKAMARMGGRVWAESAPGQGARFYLEIPK